MHFVDLEVVMVCSLWCSHFGVCSHQAAVGELRSYAVGRLHRPISVIQITAGVANWSVCPGESIFDVLVTCPSPRQDAKCCVTSFTEILQHDMTSSAADVLCHTDVVVALCRWRQWYRHRQQRRCIVQMTSSSGSANPCDVKLLTWPWFIFDWIVLTL